MKRWVGDDGCVGNKGRMNVQIWEELDGYMDEEMNGGRAGGQKDGWMKDK